MTGQRKPKAESRKPKSVPLHLALWLLLLSLSHSTALACAVCYGDPDSPLTKGALSGVWVLGGVVYAILLGFVGTAFYWMHRARRAARDTSGPLT